MSDPDRSQYLLGLALLVCSLGGLLFFAWQWLRCRNASPHADFGEEEAQPVVCKPRNAP